jgi:hypothetical protein
MNWRTGIHIRTGVHMNGAKKNQNSHTNSVMAQYGIA